MVGASKRKGLNQMLSTINRQLDRAYEQLAAGNRVKTEAEFHAYGAAYGVDTQALMAEARAKVERLGAERATRKAARIRA
jgi:hypothetical protein